MTILVTGGRGTIARAITAGLTAAGHDVRVASRQPSAVGPAAVSDADDPAPALRGISQVFLYSDPSSAPTFVAAAEAAGVKQVVLLSSLSSQGGPDDPHAKTERVIGSGSYATTYLRPGAFMSNARFWSHQFRATGQIRLPYLDAEEAPIHEQDIADAAIRVLLDGPGHGHDGCGYPMTGPSSMTRRHQISVITEVTGAAIEAVDLTPDEARAEMRMRDAGQRETLLAYWASRVGVPQPIETGVELLTARSGRSWTTWLTDNPGLFT
ncbi:NAD-dependent epimerase [Kribbella pittospori]|uniref:NAD-dependent epimerase n=1 Tax=Kribbella pittospori TaxID=722689 RepID=A0A4R0K9P6_9ACTN|nr:NAD(P)H-binding protein [Kribbella pittospori]TCC54906.1 NAD-dependent epimerase [Kribbella pittospori]